MATQRVHSQSFWTARASTVTLQRSLAWRCHITRWATRPACCLEPRSAPWPAASPAAAARTDDVLSGHLHEVCPADVAAPLLACRCPAWRRWPHYWRSTTSCCHQARGREQQPGWQPHGQQTQVCSSSSSSSSSCSMGEHVWLDLMAVAAAWAVAAAASAAAI